MVWQPFQLCVVAIFIPRCYHVYMHLYFSLDVFWEALPCNPCANVVAAKELAQLNGKEILRSGHKPRVQPCNSKKIICESSFAEVFCLVIPFLFLFHFNHNKTTNIPNQSLKCWAHNSTSTSPISPTPGKRRTVSTKLPACRRCNAERSLNSNDTVKALEKVDPKNAILVGKTHRFSNEKNDDVDVLGVQNPHCSGGLIWHKLKYGTVNVLCWNDICLWQQCSLLNVRKPGDTRSHSQATTILKNKMFNHVLQRYLQKIMRSKWSSISS